MEILKLTRKMKCKNCASLADFKIVFKNSSLVLCQNCTKELNRSLSKTTVPLPVVTKFYIKR